MGLALGVKFEHRASGVDSRVARSSLNQLLDLVLGQLELLSFQRHLSGGAMGMPLLETRSGWLFQAIVTLDYDHSMLST